MDMTREKQSVNSEAFFSWWNGAEALSFNYLMSEGNSKDQMWHGRLINTNRLLIAYWE